MCSTRRRRSRLSAARRSYSPFSPASPIGALKSALLQEQEVQLHRLSGGRFIAGEDRQFGDQGGQLASSRGRLEAGSSGCRRSHPAARAPQGDRCSSLKRARYSRPSPGRATHIARAPAPGARGRSARCKRTCARPGARPFLSRSGRVRNQPAGRPRCDQPTHHHRRLKVEPLGNRRTRSSRLAVSPIPP